MARELSRLWSIPFAVAFALGAAGLARTAVASAPSTTGEGIDRAAIGPRSAALGELRQRWPERAERAERDLHTLGADLASARLDLVDGTWETLLLSTPILPGDGVGNSLAWPEERAPEVGRIAAEAWHGLRGWLIQHRAALRLEAAEIPERLDRARIAVHEGGSLVHLVVPRSVEGAAAPGGELTAVISHGNLVLLGTQNWRGGSRPSAPARGSTPDGVLAERPDPSFEALLDATRGDLPGEPGAELPRRGAAAEGVGATRRTVVGGVYPRSNDLDGTDGTEQAGWPMPFANVVTGTGTVVTDAGGNLPTCTTGEISTTLVGPYVAIADQCGAISESASGATLDLGSSAGTDCTVPPDRSAGDTHAARTAFFTLNRIAEAGRARLPDNSWLDAPVTASVNQIATCNAFWNGSSLNFVRSGGGCRNSGESASILQTIWGQALDDNDANASNSNPTMAFPYTLAALHSARSCVGRGFVSTNCSGFGDTCLDCTGAADLDWAAHASGVPHTVAWADSFCPPGASPCGGATQCEAQIVGEAVWDLATRDLTAVPFSFSAATALEITTRLHFLASGAVASWYSCVFGGGCGATNGYLQFLAADDDNGNLNDGTPHMTAIQAAFARHEIHCATPAVANSGCAGGPTTAPTLTATPRAREVALRWTPVAGASSYRILRADGVSGCDDGKVPVGTTSATRFLDTGLLDGRSYSYVVVPIGASPACIGRASDCVSIAPVDDPRDDDCSLIFADNLESGDSVAWSSEAP